MEYSYLSELRSLLPTTTNLMALTATASDTLMAHIINDIGMISPEIVQVSPEKKNLCYGVQEIVSASDTFEGLAKQLKSERMNFKRTLIFCQRQVDCGWLYQLFIKIMRCEITDPVGMDSALLQYRMVDVFTKATENAVKEHILTELKKNDSTLRLLICTAAFGMGIDCVGITRVIHWGPTNDVETYIQQTGRSGRNEEKSYCTLLYGKGLTRFTDKQMLSYCKSSVQCRRTLLFSDFKSFNANGNRCECCDICASKCNCINCTSTISNLLI
jgi:ATP-dependent DNA helicase RecQ